MFDIFFNDSVVGQAEIIKEGLYYKIHCSCKLPNSSIHRIVVSDEENVRDLGICVPYGDRFILNARIPIKYINGENLKFQLVSNVQWGSTVASGKPVAYLEQLEAARLQYTNGQPEIVIDPIQDQPDSDQSPEHPQKSELL